MNRVNAKLGWPSRLRPRQDACSVVLIRCAVWRGPCAACAHMAFRIQKRKSVLV